MAARARPRGARAAACIALALGLAIGARPVAAQITQEMQDYCDAVRACGPPAPRPPGPPPFDPQRWGWIPIEIWPTTPDAVRQQLVQAYGCQRGPDGRYYFPPQTPVWRFEMSGTRPPFLPAPAASTYDPGHFPTNPPRCYACLGGTGDAIRLWILQGRQPASLDRCTLGSMAAQGPVYFDPASILGGFDPHDPATGPRPANEAHPYPSVVCVPQQPASGGTPPRGPRFYLPRIPPGLALNAGRLGSCAPDVINNGMMGYQCGSQFGGGLMGTVTNDPDLITGGQVAGGLWGAGCMGEAAFTTSTGVYLPGRFSPLYQTGRCVNAGGRLAGGGGRLLVQGGRACATNPLTYVVAAGAYLDYQGYQYSCAVDDLCSLNDLSGISEDEFDAMIPYNVVSGAYWRNVGAYWGLCDPLPPPRTVIRGRPRGAGCRGDVRAQAVDPPYEDGDDSGGGCATGVGGGSTVFALSAVLVTIAVRARRRRKASHDWSQVLDDVDNAGRERGR